MENENYYIVLINFTKDSLKEIHSINEVAVKEFDCQGIEEFSFDEPRVDEILGERAYSGGDIPSEVLEEVNQVGASSKELTYKYYFHGNEENVESFKKYLVTNFQSLNFEMKKERCKDWNDEWRKGYRPIEISPSLTILPEWYKENDENEIKTNAIYIYPGMGFGTGTHETTFLCLKLFVDLFEKKQLLATGRCLDFGCGSGILGIAAIKLLGYGTDFCDIDKSALDNCLQNLNINFDVNKLENSALISRDRFKVDKLYDVVFANILESVLMAEKKIIINSIKKEGWLIVSGILNHQVDSIVASFEEGNFLKTVTKESKGDWSCILFVRI